MASSAISLWESVSSEFSGAADTVGKAVAAVHGQHRFAASGIQWREGVVVTAEHAVRRAEQVRVNFGSDNSFTATVAGRDPSTDLAVLRLPENATLPVAPVDQAAELKLAQLVLALARSRRGNLVASAGIIGVAIYKLGQSANLFTKRYELIAYVADAIRGGDFAALGL